MFLHSKIRECREAKGFSVEKLLVELINYGMNLSGNTIRNWENGLHQPNADDLEQLAKYFKKPIKYFFT